jgi:hypothetical protein
MVKVSVRVQERSSKQTGFIDACTRNLAFFRQAETNQGAWWSSKNPCVRPYELQVL